MPTFYAALLGADLPPDTFASVRLGVSAGEPLPPDIYRRFRERFGVEILDGIGTTEILHIFVSNRPGRSVAGTSGHPVAGYEVELRDAEGAPVADGESGNLWVAGDSVTVGYWNRTAQNRGVLHGRFIATGDQYTRDEQGNYVYLGRADDMLKVGGIWVSPAEVEACIVEMPEVAQAAVVGADAGDGLVKPPRVRRRDRGRRPRRVAGEGAGARARAPRALQVPALGRGRRRAPRPPRPAR